MGDKKYNNYRVLHRTFIINLCYDQLGAAGFVKSNVRMLQFTLPFIYKDKFLLILGAVFEVSNQNLQIAQ